MVLLLLLSGSVGYAGFRLLVPRIGVNYVKLFGGNLAGALAFRNTTVLALAGAMLLVGGLFFAATLVGLLYKLVADATATAVADTGSGVVEFEAADETDPESASGQEPADGDDASTGDEFSAIDRDEAEHTESMASDPVDDATESTDDAGSAGEVDDEFDPAPYARTVDDLGADDDAPEPPGSDGGDGEEPDGSVAGPATDAGEPPDPLADDDFDPEPVDGPDTGPGEEPDRNHTDTEYDEVGYPADGPEEAGDAGPTEDRPDDDVLAGSTEVGDAAADETTAANGSAAGDPFEPPADDPDPGPVEVEDAEAETVEGVPGDEPNPDVDSGSGDDEPLDGVTAAESAEVDVEDAESDVEGAESDVEDAESDVEDTSDEMGDWQPLDESDRTG